MHELISINYSTTLRATLSVTQFYVWLHKPRNKVYICDRACENKACGHMIFAYFFNLSELITFYPNMPMAMKFSALV